MKTSKDYKVFKNLLHNEMCITKEDIYKMVEESVNHIVERKVDELIYNGKFQDVILHKITNIINKGKIRDNFFNQISFTDWMQNEVKNQIKNKVIDNINFDINVNVKNKE